MSTGKKSKIAIIVLSVLLLISLSLLTFGVIRVLQRSIAEESIKNNSIGAVEKDWKMEVSGMLPGDSNTKYYEVELKHEGGVFLCFRADVAKSTNQLENVLNLKVENRDSGALMCEGKLIDLTGRMFQESFLDESSKDTILTYKVTVSMDTSVGNEYQNSSLTLNFKWFLQSASTGENV